MSDAIETISYKNHTIHIALDDNPESPREWDCLGKMVCFHKRHSLGDKTDLKSSMFSGWNELERYLWKKMDAAIVLPLFMFDHSGLTISTDANKFAACDPQRWDWGQIGFVYVTKDNLRCEFHAKKLSKKMLETGERILRGEVEAYDQYLRGEVYGYEIVNDETGEQVDSLYGYFGEIKGIIDDAKAAVDSILKK